MEDLWLLLCEAERHGFDGFFVNHPFPGRLDPWTCLAALLTRECRLRMGTLVTPIAARDARRLADVACHLYQVSGGRIEVGIGGGHPAVAAGGPARACWPAPPGLERYLATLTGQWAGPPPRAGGRLGPTAAVCGVADGARGGRPPLIIGGSGAVRTPRVAAVWADEYNVSGLDTAGTAARFERARALRDEIGRGPLRLSMAVEVVVGRSLRDAYARAGRLPPSTGQPLTRLVDTCDQLVRTLTGYADIGVDRLYLRLPDPTDLAHLRMLGRDVLPGLCARARNPHVGAVPR